jgi:uncharacterized protein YecT (DUF1311 family)
MKRFSLVFLLLLPPVYLHGASFDCSKARTSVEKAICSSPELSASDDKLAQAYRAALTKVPEAAMLVREAQRKWLQFEEHKCRPTDENYHFAACLAEEWENRTWFLNQIVVRMGGVSFFFREIWLDKPCDEEDLATGLARTSPQSHKSDDADSYNGSCAFKATWPEAISDSPRWKAWNKALLDEARRFQASQDHEDRIPNHWVHFAGASWSFDNFEVSVELNMVSPTLVVATINRSYTYAHPAHHERAFNWLLKQGRELKQDNLFQPNSDWEAWMKKRVSQIIKDYEITALEADPTEAKEIAASAASVAVQSRNWQVERKGLNLIFSQDELPYLDAVMMPDVTLPWSDLKSYLNPAFEIPR